MYVDAIYDRENDCIQIAERIDGKRKMLSVPAEHVFYYEHANGTHRTIFDDCCKKFSSSNIKKFRGELSRMRKAGTRIFESDINPVFRVLASKYMGADTPKLHICFFDIEVDFDPEKGFAPPDDPFNPVTAISFYLSDTETMHTLVLCPPTFSMSDAQAIVNEFPDTILFDDEKLLLKTFLDMIEDIDCCGGWNSEGYDVPYLVNRVARIINKNETRRFCLWDQLPHLKEYTKFGRIFKTYEFVGRVHLDYLLLYQKHNTQQQHSYRLDFIGEIEVGENKTPYEGTLDDLYKKDFQRFIEYNRQDVMLLVKIDKKRKFIELANQIAHGNCVLLKTTMGSVALVEQAIINEMHKLGRVVPDRKPREDDREDRSERDGDDDDDDDGEDVRTPVVGAYVAKPKVGLNCQIGCVDINSLYPSAIRALNMSPETIVGHVRPVATMALVSARIAGGTPRAEAWDGLFATLEVHYMQDQTDDLLTVDFEDGREVEMTGAQLYQHVFEPANSLCITANGTLFRTDKEGMIPALLATWYADRKSMQLRAREYDHKAHEATDSEKKAECQALHTFWDQRQYAKKILLNSLYGALLNNALRFFDERVGQSVTLTGRSIVRHMNAKINEIITGEYDYQGAAVIAADTDSCYFSVYEIWKDDPAYADFDWSRENVIELYDAITDQTNATFTEFMQKSFNTSAERGSIIKAGRELVGSTGLFVKKKKYAILMYDKEGERLDVNGKPGKLKIMGLDLKRSDTPKKMQVFLERLLMDVLTGKPRDEMYGDIRTFRVAFKVLPAWEKGSPKKVSNLTKFTGQVAKAAGIGIMDAGRDGKVNLPGHVRASLNWNALCGANHDMYSQRITDGTRIIVCKLLPNATKFTSVAYPIDEPHLPPWFKALPFDGPAMESTIIDAKIDNLVGVLNWDLSQTQDVMGEEFFSFG